MRIYSKKYSQKNAVVSIYGMTGLLVYRQTATSNRFCKQINKGVYIVEVKGNGTVLRKSVVVN